MTSLLDLAAGAIDVMGRGGESNPDVSQGEKSNSSGFIVFIIAVAAAIIMCILVWAVLALTDPKMNSDDDTSNGNKEDSPDTGTAFAISSAHFRDIHETLQRVTFAVSGEGWTGQAAHHNETLSTLLTDLARQVADLSDGTHATVSTQAEQVNDCRSTLKNNLNELQSAIPVAQSLYFSGPTGPALSYHFQLAVSNSCTATSIDATNKMQDNAQKNGQFLDELAQKYDEALSILTAINSIRPTATLAH